MLRTGCVVCVRQQTVQNIVHPGAAQGRYACDSNTRVRANTMYTQKVVSAIDLLYLPGVPELVHLSMRATCHQWIRVHREYTCGSVQTNRCWPHRCRLQWIMSVSYLARLARKPFSVPIHVLYPPSKVYTDLALASHPRPYRVCITTY